MRSKIIVQSISPNGNIEAFVEQDEHVAFFYLRGSADTEFGVRSCWVRNLHPAPAELDAAGMVNGHPPMLPVRQCSHPSGAPSLSQSRLRVVWFEEGDAAALLEDGDPIAVIPAWSGSDGFGGYARDCMEEGPLCWPFTSDNVLRKRIRCADEFWGSWDGPSSPWEKIQTGQWAHGNVRGIHRDFFHCYPACRRSALGSRCDSAQCPRQRRYPPVDGSDYRS